MTQKKTAAERPPLISRYTFRFHLLGEGLETLFMGIFMLHEAVLRKTLGASELEITFLIWAGASFMIFASFWAFKMEGRSKSPFIIWSGIIGRGSLLFIALTSSSIVFLLLCCGVFLVNPIFIPAQNSIFQANYNPKWRGRMLGRVVLWTRWLLPVGALGCGALLDNDPDLYRVAFPVAGVIGILAYLQYARIRIRHQPRKEPRRESTLRMFTRILLENPEFFRYERNFFLYGVAFIMLLPINIFLLIDHLKMSYTEFSVARLVIAQMVLAAFSPLAGLLLDRLKVVRAAAVSFAILALYPLTLFFAWHLESTVLAYVGFALFGVAMAGVMQAWILGAMHFAGDRDAAPFQGVHVTAVGLRALIAPWLGYLTMKWFGMGSTYLISCGLLVAASTLMFLQSRSRNGAGEKVDGPKDFFRP